MKKGFMEGLRLVIGLLIVTMVIIVFFVLLTNIGQIFTKGSSVAAKSNLANIAGELQALLDDPNDFASRNNIPLNIPEGYILVGFDKEWNGDGEDDDFSKGKVRASKCKNEGIDKPAECGYNACVCFYKHLTLNDFNGGLPGNGEPPIDCKTLISDKKVHISGPADGYYNIGNCAGEAMKETYQDFRCLNHGNKKIPESFSKISDVYSSIGYEFLVIYNTCKGLSVWDTKTVYIEKSVKNENAYLFLSQSELLDNELFDGKSRKALLVPKASICIREGMSDVVDIDILSYSDPNYPGTDYSLTQGNYKKENEQRKRYAFNSYSCNNGGVVKGVFRFEPTSSQIYNEFMFIEKDGNEHQIGGLADYFVLCSTKDIYLSPTHNNGKCKNENDVNTGYFKIPYWGDEARTVPIPMIFTQDQEIADHNYAAICIGKDYADSLEYLPIYIEKGKECADGYKRTTSFRAMFWNGEKYEYNSLIYQTIKD